MPPQTQCKYFNSLHPFIDKYIYKAALPCPLVVVYFYRLLHLLTHSQDILRACSTHILACTSGLLAVLWLTFGFSAERQKQRKIY